MSNRKKPSSQTEPYHNDLSDDQLSNQWQLHNNRLNFLEQSLAKVQKKLAKLQKSIIIVSESSSELKNEFRSKLNEMIGIVSQPPINDQNLVTIDQFNQLMTDFKNLSNDQSQCIIKCDSIQRQMHKLFEKSSSQIKPHQIQDYINDRVTLAEQKNKRFLEDKLSEFSTTLHELQTSISFSKNHPHSQSNRIMQPQSNNFLNNSAFSKASSSQNGLSNSRSQNKLSNSLSSNIFDQPDPIRQQTVKRLHFAQDEQPRRYPDSAVSSQKSSQASAPSNENNSRVVYLREKLKEFQEINKKYEKKESEYDFKQKEIGSGHKAANNHKNQSTKKNSGTLYTNLNDNHYTHIQPQQVSQHPHPKPPSKQPKLHPEPLSSYRQNSSSKMLSNLSSTKTHVLSHESSAKKLDKLKSIKDYLEQTESEVEESFLEPNYNSRRRG